MSDIELRSRVIGLLGNKCSNCPIDNPIVLQVDHINGGGCRERSRFKSHRSYLFHVYKKLKKGSRDYQLLCGNCHLIKEHLNRTRSK